MSDKGLAFKIVRHVMPLNIQGQNLEMLTHRNIPNPACSS